MVEEDGTRIPKRFRGATPDLTTDVPVADDSRASSFESRKQFVATTLRQFFPGDGARNFAGRRAISLS